MLRRKVDVTGFKEEVERLRRSRLAVILLVYFAFVMDNMLLTVVVPIIPDYLYQMEYRQTEKRSEMQQENASTQLISNLNSLNPGVSDGNPKLKTGSILGTEDVREFSTSLYPLMLPQSPRKRNEMVSRNEDLSTTYSATSKTISRKQISGLNYLSPRFHQRFNSLGRPPDDVSLVINPTVSEIFVGPEVTAESQDKPKSVGGEGVYSQMDTARLKDHLAYKGQSPFERRKKSTKSSISSMTSEEMDGNLPSSKQQFRTLPTPESVYKTDSSTYPGHLSSQAKSELDIPNAKHSTSVDSNASGNQELNTQTEMNTNANASIDQILTSETPEQLDLEPTNANLNKTSYNDILPQDIINENGKVGLLFSSKAFVQLIVNPFIGPLASRIGYSLPLLVGTHNLILSALLFAYAESYTLLFVARSIQGIASSCIAISGMGIIAECYPDDRERGRMQGMVMGGIALGVLAGYPMGGLLYDFTSSKMPPFLFVAVLTAILALVQLAVFNPRPTPERLIVATPLSGLIRDPYILVTAGAVMVSTSAMAVLEPCLPIWLTDTLHPQKWQLGTAFIPDSLGYLVGTSCTAGTSYRIGRWRAAIIALMMVAFAAATVPEAKSMLALAGPHLFLGMGVGIVDAALMPLLAAIVDARHVAAYGAVYSIAQAAVALAYGFGPLVGGVVVRQIGFPWLMRCVAIINLCYCPLLFSLTALNNDLSETQAILMAAPDPNDYTCHTTASVQPREASLRYKQLFDEEED